jgi:hypothetical protein
MVKAKLQKKMYKVRLCGFAVRRRERPIKKKSLKKWGNEKEALMYFKADQR